MSNTDSGWRKRQVALEIKAENARAMGLDYEPDKTIEMAREAGVPLSMPFDKWCEKFAELVRADEREACAKVIESHGPFLANGAMLAEAIRAKGQA
jgi:hypothetical protein